jgi:long-subunit acyl-CoA synthetase (AMP-forming)
MAITRRSAAILPGTGATTLCEAFQAGAAAFGPRIALRTAGSTPPCTWIEYAAHVERIAGGLAALGVRPGDPVALLLVERPELFWADTAALHVGAIPFAVYPSFAPGQTAALLAGAGARVLVTERAFAAAVAELDVPGLEHVVVVDAEDRRALSLAALEAAGARRFDFEARWRAVAADTPATIAYTAGTTGPPKGAQLTHANVLWEAARVAEALGLEPGGRTVACLPVGHAAHRMLGHYLQLYSAATLTTVAEPAHVVAALADARPTLCAAEARIWEALMVALEAGGITDPAALAPEAVAQLLHGLGLDRAEVLVSAVAPAPMAVLAYFAALGLEISEAWGMAETGGIGTCNPPGAARIGTVGPPLAGVELRLLDDGELVLRGPNVMAGYRDGGAPPPIDPHGWMHTGDVAEIDGDGYVRIVGRQEELIVTDRGWSLSPVVVEQQLKAASPLIGHACAVCDGHPFTTALIVLDAWTAGRFAAERDLPDAAPEALAEDDELRARVALAVDAANAHLAQAAKVRRFTILPVRWRAGGVELTPTRQLRRGAIAERYAAEIEAMYL